MTATTNEAVPARVHGDGLRRVESRFDGAGGRSLFRRAWLPVEPGRVAILVHGFGEHSGRYAEIAEWLAARGYAVHAYDHMGHGQSSGRRGHASSFADFHDDLERFISGVRAEHPGLPCVLVGHSMGGLIVSSFAVMREPDVDLIVTSGPALALGPDLSPLKIKIARLLRRVWPTLTMEAGLDVNGLSRDPEVIAKYEADPLVHGKATAAFAASMTESIEATQAGASRVRLPMLMLHGEDDPLCAAEGSRQFFAGLGSDGAGHALHVYPGLRHEIFNEPEREQVWGDLHAWVDERLGAAAADAGATPS